MSDETKEFGIFVGEEIFKNLDPKQHLIEGILNVRDNLVISSKAGTGKSILALQLLSALTTGSDFLGTFPIAKKCRVLYVQTEGDRAETVHRIGHMEKAIPFDHGMWAHYNAVGITLNTPDGLGKFLGDVMRVKMDFDVILIDPLYATVKGSINADDVATDWQRSTRLIRDKFPNVTYVVFHHEPSKDVWQDGARVAKPADDLMGSSMWGAWMSANYKMEKREDGLIVLRAGKGGGKGRTGQSVPEIHMRLIEPSPLHFIVDDSCLGETEIRILNVINTHIDKKFRRIEFESMMDKSKPTVCRALAKLLKEKKIVKTTEEGLVYYVKAS